MAGAQKPLELSQLLRRERDFLGWLERARTRPEVTWYLNPYTIEHLKKGHFPVSESDHVVADGRLMARTIRQAHGGPCESLHFDYSGLAGPVFKRMAETGLKLAVIGGKPGEAEAFRQIIERRHKGLSVVFAEDGYFTTPQEAKVTERLAATAPDLLLLSMGSPRQERFAATLRETCPHPMAIVTCGGFIGQTATRRKDYYPKLIVKTNLRWLYRLYREPQMYARVARYYLPFMARKRLIGPDLPFRP